MLRRLIESLGMGARPSDPEDLMPVGIYVWRAASKEHDEVVQFEGDLSRRAAYDIACRKLSEDESAVRVRVAFKENAFVEAVRKAA